MKDLENRVGEAIKLFWLTRDKQSQDQGIKTGRKDAGLRAAVTGGKHLDGFTQICRDLFIESGLPEAQIFWQDRKELPGFYRAEKNWDLVVVDNRPARPRSELEPAPAPGYQYSTYPSIAVE